MKLLFVLLILILFVPKVSATQGFHPNTDVRTWQQIVLIEGNGDGDTPEFSFVGVRPHGLIVLNSWNWLHVETYYRSSCPAPAVSGQNCQVSFALVLDGDQLGECSWNVSQHAVSAQGTVVDNEHYSFDCPPMRSLIGSHTIETTIPTPVAVQNPVVESIVSIRAVFVEEVSVMTNFESAVGLTALELGSLLAFIVIGLMVNARGRDLGSKVAGAFILLIVGLVGLAIRNVWIGGVEAAVVLLLIAGYAFVRAAVDEFDERKKKPKKTDPGAM